MIANNFDPKFRDNLAEDVAWFFRQSRSRRIRSMRDFAESEVIIPDGPFEGRRFRCDRQPYARLWFDAVDSGKWSRFVATGPTQSGKSLSCFIIPTLYHLFELEETVICGLPDMEMASDKWREDLLPVILRSRYRDLIPSRGGGSRGGKIKSIEFKNGATLRFMSGGGGDKSRAGFTARVLVVTETDGLDEAGAKSRESDKLTQLEQRTKSYGDQKRVYLECTVSLETGRTWQEYTQGTESRIVLRCPHCSEWVTPDRPDLKGWQEAESKEDAKELGHFTCPSCRDAWTEADRVAANHGSKLIHSGETIAADGRVHGSPPKTDTLGFRWSAVNNLFQSSGLIAADEWRAARAADQDNAEKELRQFVWTLPVAALKESVTGVDVHAITTRTVPLPQGIAPAATTKITAGIDLGKYLAHWTAIAWLPGAAGHVLSYGRIEVAAKELGLEFAILQALNEFADLCRTGFPIGRGDGPLHPVDAAWIDAGYETPTVYKFCRENKEPFAPVMGQASTQRSTRFKSGPTSTGSVVKFIGEGYHFALIKDQKVRLAELDADHWKTWLDKRLACPREQTGAMTLFRAPANDHLAFAKHLTAERKEEEFIPNRGLVTRWVQVNKNNHWLDSTAYACAAGHFAGVRLLEDKAPAKKKSKSLQQLRDEARRRSGR